MKKLTLIVNSGAPELFFEEPYSHSVENGMLVIKYRGETLWFPLSNVVMMKEEELKPD